MARDVNDSTPIASRAALVESLEAGCKGADATLRIGTEHEKIPFYADTRAPVPYAGIDGRGGIRALLEGLQSRLGWAPIMDRDALIGLADPIAGGAISLEPGGQFELSGAPLTDIHATAAELNNHLTELGAVAREIGVKFLDLGASPKWSRDETPVMPKQRYAIMADYMPLVGTRGLDMMFRTATVQANLDFTSEADMTIKMRVGIALQPIVTALFANSPFIDGRPSGRLSERSWIWRDTDADRTGMLPFVFEDGFGFERYVDYALDVPMYFVKRGDVYHDVAGARFRDLLAGQLTKLPGERAMMSDWANHLSTIFPEVRLKAYLEMRGADVGPRAHITALPALFAGLYYDRVALDEAYALIREWPYADMTALRDATPCEGLAARIGGRSARDVATEALAIARRGLARRARRDNAGRDETIYLAPLEQIAEEGKTLAQRRLDAFNGAWRSETDHAFEDCVLTM